MKAEVKSLYKIEDLDRMYIVAESVAKAISMWRAKKNYHDTAEPSSIQCIGNEIDRPDIFE